MKKVKWQKAPNSIIMGPEHITDSHIIFTREYFNKRITYAPAVDAIAATETASARWDRRNTIDLEGTAPELALFFGSRPHEGDEVAYTGATFHGSALWMSSHGTASIWISTAYSDMIQALHLTARLVAGGGQIYLDAGSANDQVGILAAMVGDDPQSAAIVEALRILAQTPETDTADE